MVFNHDGDTLYGGSELITIGKLKALSLKDDETALRAEVQGLGRDGPFVISGQGYPPGMDIIGQTDLIPDVDAKR